MPIEDGYPFRFTCRRSGNCCAIPGGFVRVTPEDVSSISTYLRMEEAAFRSRFLDAPGDRLTTGLGDRCVFLEDGSATACSIYPVRPQKCRTWPFWPELLDDPEAMRKAKQNCPGIEKLNTCR